VPTGFPTQLQSAIHRWWTDQRREKSFGRTTVLLALELWEFARDSTPARRRRRYGDMDYDWEHRVNTTSGTVRWRERLLGMFHSAYQPTDPPAFEKMMEALPIDATDFTFIDLGSGKGRTLLLASEYRFAHIVGVELLPELHRAAEENIRAYCESRHSSANIESLCIDACDFDFPPTKLVVYLFHPLPEAGLLRAVQNLEQSLTNFPREVWVVYHNPVLEKVLSASKQLERFTGGEHFSIYRSHHR
jgi:SAM-dependent methyltransferase